MFASALVSVHYSTRELMESPPPTCPEHTQNAQKTQLEVGLPGLFGTKYHTECCNLTRPKA